jgi:hypothetical protein
MKNKKLVLRFLYFFIISLIFFQIIEWSLHHFIGLDLHNLEFGWIGLTIIYGFKYHIFCCLIPAIWAGWKCRHKSCQHEHCKKD